MDVALRSCPEMCLVMSEHAKLRSTFLFGFLVGNTALLAICRGEMDVSEEQLKIPGVICVYCMFPSDVQYVSFH